MTCLACKCSPQREFCSLLNQALREDDADTVGHAVTCTHAINTFCVARRGGIPVPWPSEHVLYRGGAMPRCFQSFFAVGKAYRAPMFIATSVEQDVSVDTFLMRLPPAAASQSPPFQEPVLWRFHLDGALPPNRRCVHVNFIDRTDGTVHGEDEFLFAPYSTFTVRALEWSPQPSVNAYTMRPHYILRRFTTGSPIDGTHWLPNKEMTKLWEVSDETSTDRFPHFQCLTLQCDTSTLSLRSGG